MFRKMCMFTFLSAKFSRYHDSVVVVFFIIQKKVCDENWLHFRLFSSLLFFPSKHAIFGLTFHFSKATLQPRFKTNGSDSVHINC